MAHLGDDASALVDGQLSPERAEAALAHLVGCERCAGQVAAERAARRRLLQARDVAPSADLTQRLLRLPVEDVPPDLHGPRGAAGRALAPLTDRRVRRRLVRRSGLVVAGAAGVAGALVVVGAVVERSGDPAMIAARLTGGGSEESTLVVSTDVLRLATAGPGDAGVASAAATASAALDLSPSGDRGTTRAALLWLEANDWAVPDLPEGARIERVERSVEDDVEVVELEVVRDGHPVSVVEQRAVLDPATLTGLPTEPVGEHVAYRLPAAGTALVLQCEDVTVLVVGMDADPLARELAAAFPASEPGAGMTDRLDRGWETVVGWTDLLVRTQ